MKKIWILFFFCSHTLLAQSSLQAVKKLSKPEKCWVFFHPFIAKKTFSLTLKAREAAKLVATDTLLDKDENGGQVDAFRHSYWMALLAQHFNAKKIRKLGKAHEKGNYLSFKKGEYEEGTQPDSLASVMDLHNNAIGIKLGKENKKTSEEELKKIVISSILKGDMRILKKDAEGNYLTCEGTNIDFTAYKLKWNIPKCLVPSSENKK